MTKRRTVAHCDRCGFKYYHSQLKKEWNNLMVCPECWEPKHPQLFPKSRLDDAIALRHPRPDRDQD